MTLWPDYLVERARLRPPVGCLGAIVKDSTPVVSFGNPMRAKIATIGLNPSYKDFLNKDRSPLPESQRCLATLPSLGIQRYDEINDQIAVKIIDKCAKYFDKPSYKEWFRPLDEILRNGASASYYSKEACLHTACHLDLSPWATSDTWKNLSDPVRLRLMRDSESFLCELLRRERYHLVIANGKTVREELEQSGLVTWDQADTIEGKEGKNLIILHVGESGATLFLAWSCYLQRHIKKFPKHLTKLESFVKNHYTEFSGGRRAT